MMPLKMPTSKTSIKYSGGSHRPRSMQLDRVPKVDLPEQEEVMGLINGRTPGSAYEWNMAKALWFYGWDGFMYQLAVYGGFEIRGGQVLDFLVPTKPNWTALAVDGGYWHSNPQKEQLKDANMIQALRQKGYHVKNEVLHAIDKNSVTFEAAKQFVFTEFGRI